MHYAVTLTIPAGTTEDDPAIEYIRLPCGVVERVAILFPAGCHGYAHVVIYEYEHQAWPTHEELSYIGDDVLIEFPGDYELPQEWNLFSVRGWNEDTTHDHAPTVFITVTLAEPPATDLAAEYPNLARFVDALRGQ